MPRRLPNQVPQTVSRLLDAGFLKQPPAWFEAASSSKVASSGSRADAAKTSQFHVRDRNNSKKKARAQGPKLAPKPIAYDEDKVRQQFFRDHPWEAYRPKTLVEMSDRVGTEQRFKGDPRKLRSYGRAPSVEDFIACTLAAHRQGGLSLSQAYHNTLSSFYGIKAEQEHARRYAYLEAKYYGGDLGRSETQRGFDKEEKALESWAAWASGDMQAANAADPSASTQQAKAPRVKRTDNTFTAGEQYLEAAKAFREGKLNLDALGGGAVGATAVSATSSGAAAPVPPANPNDDFLGLRSSTIRDGQSEEGAPRDGEGDSRYRTRVGSLRI